MKRPFSSRMRIVVLSFCVLFSLFAIYFFHHSILLDPGDSMSAHGKDRRLLEREHFRKGRDLFLTEIFQQHPHENDKLNNAAQIKHQQPIAMADVAQQLLQNAVVDRGNIGNPDSSLLSGSSFAKRPPVVLGVPPPAPFGSPSRPFTVDIVFVIGSGRSGTSMITRSLEILDFYVPSTVKAAPMNAKGFWEDRELNTHNDAVLVTLGYRNIGPTTQRIDLPNQPQTFVNIDLFWQSFNFLSSYIQIALHQRLAAASAFTPSGETSAAKKLCLPTKNNNKEEECVIARVGIKDPRISRLMPYWQTVLQQYGKQYLPFCLNSDGNGNDNDRVCFQIRPRYVITYRNPIAFVQSVLSIFKKNMDNDPLGATITMKHWLICYVTALYYTKSSDRIFFHYEEFLKNPSQNLKLLTEFVGLDLNFFDPSKIKEFVDSFVEKNMNHHQPTLTELQTYESKNQLNGFTKMYDALFQGETAISQLNLAKPPFDTSRLLLDFSHWKNNTVPKPIISDFLMIKKNNSQTEKEKEKEQQKNESSVTSALEEVKNLLKTLLGEEEKDGKGKGKKIEKHLERFDDLRTLIKLLVEKTLN